MRPVEWNRFLYRPTLSSVFNRPQSASVSSEVLLALISCFLASLGDSATRPRARAIAAVCPPSPSPRGHSLSSLTFTSLPLLSAVRAHAAVTDAFLYYNS